MKSWKETGAEQHSYAFQADISFPTLPEAPKPSTFFGYPHGGVRGLRSKLGKATSLDLLLFSKSLFEAATAPAARRVTGGAERLMGFLSFGMKACLVPGAAAGAAASRHAESGSTLAVELKLLSGCDHRMQVEVDLSVAAFRERVQMATGLAPQQQVIVIVEDRARLPGISKIARKVQTSISSTRRDLRSAVISWVNFIFLPEVFNRELYGRGVISWAKGTTWYQSLQEVQNRAAVAAAASQDVSSHSAKVQIELLSGQVQLLEVDVDASLGELKAAIEQRLGILKEQQRLLVLERQGPGRLTNLTNRMLLHTFSGMKLALGAVAWAGSTLLYKPEATFPVCVRTTTGRTISLTITGETTVNQLRSMLEDGSLAVGEDVRDVKFPSHLPPVREEVPTNQIIRTVGV